MLFHNRTQYNLAEYRWLHHLAQCQNPQLRVVLFPYAGGGSSAFREWAAIFPDDVEVLVFNMPGLEQRKACGIESINAAIGYALPELYEVSETPLLFVGHSFGARLAFESARQLYVQYGAVVDKVVLSACGAPSRSSKNNIHTLPDARFMDVLQKLGGIPDVLVQNKSVFEMYLPSIRHDIKLCEQYTVPASTRLPSRAAVWGGRADPSVQPHSMLAWQTQFCNKLTIESFVDGHFFIRSEFLRVRQLLRDYAEEILLRATTLSKVVCK